MTAVVVRYTTKPESAAENARLVRDVYAELAETRPPGFEYATYQLDDGVTFVHVAVLSGGPNPLTESPAFARFQEGIAQRCAAGPEPAGASVVGSYGMISG